MGRTGLSSVWPWLAAAALAAGLAAFLWGGVDEAVAGRPGYRAGMAVRAAAAPADDILAGARDSVYLVTVELPSGRRSPVGTAFVVERRGGVKALATSARVADLFRRALQTDPDFNGARMMAAQPRPPDYPAVRVTAVEVHPAFDALARASGGRAYDVALLLVDDPARLGPPLALARRSALESMKAGDPVVLAGYLAPDLEAGDLTRPVPGAEAGVVTAMLDFRRTRGRDGENQLLQSSLVPARGAAGAPVFDAAGSVVGVYADGAPLALLRGAPEESMAADALVSDAARADLLGALLDGSAPDGLGAIVDAWAAAPGGPDPLDQLKARAGPGAEIALVFSGTSAAAEGDPQFPGYAAAWFEAALPGPGLYLAVARGGEGAEPLAVFCDGTGAIAEVGAAGGPVSTAMARIEDLAALRMGVVVRRAGPVSVQLYRARAPGL